MDFPWSNASNDADGMADSVVWSGSVANSVDPDQIAQTVGSGSALFAQACPSENLGSIR